ncbi:MAG: aspartate--tRNA ligase [Candidatus Omnitrophica bacterium]|nr:aspartate--tRNA ligase [Candidatus Omnitrophota bacterium]MDD5138000.1 aspartate--tRNA ligase [Candidatus Omnitrophota bacterium]
MLRTHTCGELKKEHAGQSVVLCGWVHRRRDHGKLIFIDLRDRYGYTQVMFSPKDSPQAHRVATDLRAEFAVRLKGLVNLRPKNNINPDIPTGEIELIAQELEILNPSLTPPFEIADDLVLSEDVRLPYRYLDLRRPGMFKLLSARHQMNRLMREFLSNEGFIEVETPILTKSTPEGARDYLVPSRVNPGKFFALPQSPQLFKQLLMVSGFDRYFQIAKCFRDEDLRADRQPEFTQMDMEMSFVEEEDIFSISEKMFVLVLKELKGVTLATPFPRISYKEAMEKYGCDKPDLRRNKEDASEFSFVWVVDFPLFKYDDEEKRWDSEHHPFTAPHAEDIGLLESGDLGRIRSRSYDLVLNGNEISSGSIRIHDQALQHKIFEILRIPQDEIIARFGFLLEAFKYGAPPHGGIAFGLDRILAILFGTESIRDIIAFPKTQKAVCPLTQAPSDVTDKQLKELHIRSIAP